MDWRRVKVERIGDSWCLVSGGSLISFDTKAEAEEEYRQITKGHLVEMLDRFRKWPCLADAEGDSV